MLGKMITVVDEALARAAAQHLANADPVLAPLIRHYGLCTLRPHSRYYEELTTAIVGQQLSVQAAASINKRFGALFDKEQPNPETALKLSDEQLRAVGFSRAKVVYLRDLSQHVLDGRIQFDRFEKLSDEQIIAELTAVKGIGEWTAHMFLMFCMARANVLITGDLGLRTAVKRNYKLDELPTPKQIETIATKNHWQPYRTIACWYLWQSLDNKTEA